MTEEGKRHTHHRNDIIDLLIDMRLNQGYSRQNLVKFLREAPYNLSQSVAYEYVRDAAKEFENRAIVNFGDDLREDIERMEVMKQNAFNRGDFKLEKEIMSDINKLKGHYVERIEHRGKVETGPIKLIFGKDDAEGEDN